MTTNISANDYLTIGTPVNSEDYKLFTAVVNQGIDSHLEAFTQSKFFFDCGKFQFHFHKSELHILIRRLEELEEKEIDINRKEDIIMWIFDISNVEDKSSYYHSVTHE